MCAGGVCGATSFFNFDFGELGGPLAVVFEFHGLPVFVEGDLGIDRHLPFAYAVLVEADLDPRERIVHRPRLPALLLE